MLHLSVLLANPGHEIPAADLAAGVAALVPPGRPIGGGDGCPHAVDARPTSGRQPVLDEAGIRRYRRRLDELRTEIDDLERRGEDDLAARSSAEQRWLVAELAGAVGLGGRVRSFPDETERARIAVGKAIRRAVARITQADPQIGAHLGVNLHTGAVCWYLPADLPRKIPMGAVDPRAPAEATREPAAGSATGSPVLLQAPPSRPGWRGRSDG